MFRLIHTLAKGRLALIHGNTSKPNAAAEKDLSGKRRRRS
jgi:hypothetical protein